MMALFPEDHEVAWHESGADVPRWAVVLGLGAVLALLFAVWALIMLLPAEVVA